MEYTAKAADAFLSHRCKRKFLSPARGVNSKYRETIVSVLARTLVVDDKVLLFNFISLRYVKERVDSTLSLRYLHLGICGTCFKYDSMQVLYLNATCLQHFFLFVLKSFTFVEPSTFFYSPITSVFTDFPPYSVS